MRFLNHITGALALVLAVTLLFHSAGTSEFSTVYAQSEYDNVSKQIEAVKRQKREAERKAKLAQQKLKRVKNQKTEVKEDLAEVIDQIDTANIRLQNLERKIEALDLTLDEEVQNLQDAEIRMQNRDKLLKSRVNLMYKGGFVSYLEVLVEARDFSDFIDRYHALQSLVKQDQQLLEDNKRDRDQIAEQKKKIEANLNELKTLYAQTDEIRGQLFDKERQKEVMIASLNRMEHDLLEVSEEQEQQVMELARKESELIRKRQQIELTYSGGKLAWPVPSTRNISSGYGYRTHPVTGERNKMHKGIDIAAPRGTDIVAAEDGVVIVAQWTNGYGNTVIVDHGSNTWTLYAHIRSGGIKVKEGQVVKRGQKVAEVGSTGRSTGNHLHFEVRVNQNAVNPMGYLN
jgi:murein DD-endopeptidase MepM/ murein hydrolase activator NlpD